MSNVNNNVTIFGNVANVTQSNYTRDDGSVVPIARYYLIINQGKNSKGDEITNAISTSLYGNNAKVALDYIKVGDCLGVEGTLASNLVEEESGSKQLHVNVNANTIRIGKNLRCAINRVGLLGRLAKDPVINNYKGTYVANFTLIVPRIVKKGEKEKSDLFNVVVFGENKVKFVQRFLGEGMLVYVNGKINSSSYESEGKKKYIIKVVAESIDFAESKRATQMENQREEKKVRAEEKRQDNYLSYEKDNKKNDYSNRSNNNNNRNVNNSYNNDDYRGEKQYNRYQNNNQANGFDFYDGFMEEVDGIVKSDDDFNRFAMDFMDGDDFLSADIF